MENSAIEWTDHTYNPWIGCTKVSPGCDNCYAETLMDKRHGRVRWGPHGERQQTKTFRDPYKWAKQARGTGKRPKVFCLSLGDILDNQVPKEFRWKLWAMIEATPELDWLLLTKRPQLFGRLVPQTWVDCGCPENVWWGISVEDQERFEERGRWLNQIKCVYKFWSVEPMLEPIDTTRYPGPYRDGCPDVDWVIVGGESGPGARTMDPTWVRDLRNEVQAMGAAFYMKQAGSVRWTVNGKKTKGKGSSLEDLPDDLRIRDFPKWRPYQRTSMPVMMAG